MLRNLKFISVEALPPSLIFFFHTWNQNNVKLRVQTKIVFQIPPLQTPPHTPWNQYLFYTKFVSHLVVTRVHLLVMNQLLQRGFCCLWLWNTRNYLLHYSPFRIFNQMMLFLIHGFEPPDSCPHSSKPFHHDLVVPTYNRHCHCLSILFLSRKMYSL